MAKFNFNLRDPKALETSIHLIVRWNNNRLVYPTRETINPKFWEDDKKKRNFQRAKEVKAFPEYPEFNARLNKIEHEARSLFRQFQNDNDNVQPSIEQFREMLNANFDKGTMQDKGLFGFIDRFIAEAENKVNDKTGKPLSPLTIRAYKNTRRHLTEYKQAKKKRIDFDVITLDFYQDFNEYLSKTKGFSTNTIGKQIKVLKTFMSEATERGVNTNMAFKSRRFKVISENTDSIYLTKEELAELYKLDLSNAKRLERVRDLFIVGCWTGLRFSDLSTISQANIKGNMLDIVPQKTSDPVVIPIHPTVKEIMKKYRGENGNSLPKAITNVKMNEYLKEIGKKVKALHETTSTAITKGGKRVIQNFKKYELVSTHTARRSFASNLYLDGVPPITIMKITGHKTEKAFMRYIKITPDENAKILELHWQKQNKLKAV